MDGILAEQAEERAEVMAFRATGMTPDEADQLVHAAKHMMFPNISSFVRYATHNFDELESFKTAEADGRLRTLPCHIGDKLYARTGDIISTFVVDWFGITTHMVFAHWHNVEGNYGNFRFDCIPASMIGKKVFLSREEAERQ